MDKEKAKKNCAEAALKYIEDDMIVGVGTGSTVNYFIDALATIKHKIEGTVASSVASAERLKSHGITVFDLNAVDRIDVYVDGADEVNDLHYMIKGGGGAHTREKIVAAASQKFICIADSSKKVDVLGAQFPIPVEVIPMARSLVGRAIVGQGGDPEYREGFTTDNGNIILDIHNMPLMKPLEMEQTLNNFPGVVENGIFAKLKADIVILGNENGTTEI